MQRRAITGMPLEAITREAAGQPLDQAIAGLLGHHAGGSDRQAMAIATHQGDLGPAPKPQRQHPIDNHETGWRCKPLQRAQHGQFGGAADAMTINLLSRGLAEGPLRRRIHDQWQEPATLQWPQRLAVGEPGRGQGWQRKRRQHHRSREHWPEQAAPPHFINPGANAGIVLGIGIGRRRRAQTAAEERRRRRLGSPAGSSAGSAAGESGGSSGSV